MSNIKHIDQYKSNKSLLRKQERKMIPCYVSGKGMHASEVTWTFKTSIITCLEETGLGYDTRYNYYRKQFPDMETEQLIRMICDPMEYYDLDWPEYRIQYKHVMSKEEMATRFMLLRDNKFREEAQVAIYCFDEAGFGSGINVMRFLYDKKPILGFLNQENKMKSLNVSNVLQLKAEFPRLVHLYEYRSMEEIRQHVIQWLTELNNNKQQQLTHQPV